MPIDIEAPRQAQVWEASERFLHESGFGSKSGHDVLGQHIIGLEALPGHRNRVPFARPERINLSNTAYSPAPDTVPAKLPWWVPVVYGGVVGVPMVVGSVDAYRGYKNKDPRRVRRGGFIAGLGLGFACLPGAVQATEIAPVAEILTLQDARESVLKWKEFTVTDDAGKMHRYAMELSQPNMNDNISLPHIGDVVATRPFKDGLNYSLAVAALRDLDRNEKFDAPFVITTDNNGKDTAYWLIQESKNDTQTVYLATGFGKDNVYEAGFHFIIENQGGALSFFIQKDGEATPTPLAPSGPLVDDGFSNVAFKIKPLVIFLPTPAVVSTESPTAIPTPTETPDPNRPVDAVGDKDPITGYYKNEAGQHWIPNPENPALTGWYTSNMKNGSFPLVDANMNLFGSSDAVPFLYFSKINDETLPDIGTLSHPDISDEYRDGFGNDISQLTNSLSTGLMLGFFHHFNPSIDLSKATDSELAIRDAFMREFATDTTGKYIVPIQVPNNIFDPDSGFTTIKWNPAKDGAQTIQVGWEDLDITKGPIYDIKSPFPMRLQYILDDGPLKSFVATSKTNLSDTEKNILAISPIWLALRLPTLPSQFDSLYNIRNNGKIYNVVSGDCWDANTQIGLTQPYIVFGK